MTAPTPPKEPVRQGSNLTESYKRPKWAGMFLLALRENGNILRACETAGVSRTHAYSYRDRDPRFREQWQDAIEDAVDSLEQEAWRRARDGVRRVKFSPLGEKYEELQYSDPLLMFLLKAHREKFKEKPQITINYLVQNAGEIADQFGLDPDQVLELLKKHMVGNAMEPLALPERTLTDSDHSAGA